MPPTTAIDIPVSISVPEDGMSVRVAIRSGASIKALDAPMVIAHLTSLGVTLTTRGEAEIQELCRPRKAGRVAPPVLVATGTPAVHDTRAYLQLIDPIGQVMESSRQVKAGDPIATLVPHVAGRDGVDVFGKPIHRRQAEAVPVIDSSLTLAPDGRTYLAAIDGAIRVRGNGPAQEIAVIPCFIHAGDLVGGDDRGSSRRLHSAGEIIVDGSVTGATLQAGGDIRIVGQIENSTVSGEGRLCVRGVENTTVDVAGDCFAAEITRSRIGCGGALDVEHGNIVGGHVIAAGGLCCKSIGSANLVKTLIEVGIDHRLRERLATVMPEMEARLTKAAKIRQAVEPLLRDAQALTPQQQLRVAALLAEADCIEEQAQKERRELRQEYATALARCKHEVRVSHIIHAGVTIRFPGVQTTVRIPLHGPCRVIMETTNGVSRIVLCEDGAECTPLELCHLDEDWRDASKELAA